VALAGLVTAVRLFSVALPNVAIDVTMDRGDALARAAELSAEQGWGSSDDRSAASFGLADAEVQTFVELEGGGAPAFAGLSSRGLYEPYQWRVRRFAERRVEEGLVAFTPDGRPYGFRLRLGEDDPGVGNLDSEAAQALATTTAQEWDVDIDAYRLLETSQETLPVGRVDHELVFERTDETVGDGRFRMRVRVAGSRVSELTHFVYVPEAFSRRYGDMRSTNDAIALGSQTVFMLVFVLLGAGVGSALLLRQGWLEWRTPLAWGGAIAFLFGLNTVNQLPLSWMGYDTALSASNFALQQVGAAVAIGLLGAPLIAFFLLAGESLGRRAFPSHVQQWRFWSPEVASSTTATGMTLAPYLLVCLQVGYVVLFYLGTRRLEGWWSPADALVQPDLLATYLPWLQAVSLALFASFWEESVFRAVPIAAAALLGDRFGRRGLWIWSAVAFQAVVFAAAHANYPQQPPYARVVELTGPALLWGIVYVRFGLVPTILAHYLYDLSLFSLVLFESQAFADQAVIVAAALAPVVLIVVARLRVGGRARPPDWAFNGAWRPAEGETARRATEPVGSARRDSGARRLPAWVVPLGGGVGTVLWVAAQITTPPPRRLWADADAARAVAIAELRDRGVAVGAWGSHVTATSGPTEGREYVFEEAGPEAYAQLSGTYFDTPAWIVRFADWGADPEARVAEYRVWVGEGGGVRRIWHALPEARPGSALDIASARAVALTAVEARLGVARSGLREVEAEETSLPSRTDWTLTFAEIGLLEGVGGEARVQVRIAGDEVVDVVRSIRVPEEWVRERRALESRRTVVAGGFLLLLAVCFGAAAIAGVVSWSRRRLATGVAIRLGGIVLAALALAEANGWPATAAGFSTAQRWGFQAASVAIALVLAAVIAAPAIGLVGALAVTWLAGAAPSRAPRGTAVALGVLVAGLVGVGGRVFAAAPPAHDYSGAAALVPLLDGPLGIVTPYFLFVAALLAALAARARFVARPTVQSAILTLLAVASVVAVPTPLQASLPLWGLAALVISLGVVALLRVLSAAPALVPGLVGTIAALESLAVAVEAPYAGARAGGLLGGLVVCVLAWASTRMLGSALGGPAQSAEETRASVGSE
jgi:hypothetical protein